MNFLLSKDRCFWAFHRESLAGLCPGMGKVYFQPGGVRPSPLTAYLSHIRCSLWELEKMYRIQVDVGILCIIPEHGSWVWADSRGFF